MEPITLLIGLIGALLVFFLKPLRALIVYSICLFWYSQYLTVSFGTIDFTVTKIIILGLFANIFFRTNLVREFKWNLMDTFVVVFVFGQLIALIISKNVPVRIFIERQGSISFNTILPYFASRLIINSKTRLLIFIKALIIIAIPLAFAGAYQSITGYNIAGFMSKYYKTPVPEIGTRLGLYRATVNFRVAITFGLFFASIAPLCIGLWKQNIWKKPTIIVLFVIMIIGIISSMSSAPLLSIVTSLIVLASFRFRGFWTASFLVIFGVGSILFVQTYSNQPIYEYLTRYAFSSENAFYRLNLIQKTFFGGGMTGHWLTGYGYVRGYVPGEYNIDYNWGMDDFVNIYVAIIVRFGLLGLLPFLGINILYYKRLYQASKLTSNKDDLWFIWCFLSTLIGWNVAMITVSALNQVNTLLYILIAICCNMPFIMKSEVLFKSQAMFEQKDQESHIDNY